MKDAASAIGKPAQRLLAQLAAQKAVAATAKGGHVLVRHELAARRPDGRLEITAAGRAYLRRLALERSGSGIDPFRGQHLGLTSGVVETPAGRVKVAVDAAESPFAWLARRKGRDGRALIAPEQLQAGERLRADFTRAQIMPRVTANWSAIARDGGPGQGLTFTEAMVGARQRLRRAFEAVGPEFVGLLLDVCCFLKGLEDVERERGWPPRSAKVVLQIALDRLARHYGYAPEARGRAHTELQSWLAPDAAFIAGQ
jgi:hypothetical protein